MMKSAGVVFAAIFIAAADMAHALDASIGLTTTCANWLQDRADLETRPTAADLPSAWVIGFLQGYDWGCNAAKPLALDVTVVLERVDRICRSRAVGTSLMLVAQDLIEQLRAERGSGACGH